MSAIDNLFNYMNKLDDTFSKLTNDYNYISSNITKLLNVSVVPFGDLIDLDISMNDLSINIQSILFIIKNVIECEENNENYKNDSKYIEAQILKNEEQFEKQKKTEVLVENTMQKMMPVFLLCMMMYDNESVLKSNSFCNFGKNKNNNNNNNNNDNNILNGSPNLNIVSDIICDVYIPELD